MTYGYVCVSHDPPLASECWHEEPGPLRKLLVVAPSLPALAGVPSVSLEPDARWLALHYKCEVWLIDSLGVHLNPADPDPEPAEAKEAAAQAKEEPAAEVVEAVGEPKAEPKPTELESRRRRSKVPAPPWVCEHCNVDLTEEQVLLSYGRWRKLLCQEGFKAESARRTA